MGAAGAADVVLEGAELDAAGGGEEGLLGYVEVGVDLAGDLPGDGVLDVEEAGEFGGVGEGLGQAELVDFEDLRLDGDAAVVDGVAADDDEVGVEGLGDADGGGAGGPEVDGKAEVVEGVLAVVAGDGEEAGGGEALVEGVGEGVADPGEVGLAGAVVEGEDEDDAAAGVETLQGLERIVRVREERRRSSSGGQLFKQPAEWRGPCHRYEYRASVYGMVGEVGFDDAGEAEDGGPLAFAVGLPDDVAVEQGCDFGGGEVAVEVEVFGVGGFVAAAEVELVGGGCPLGGEDEGSVVGSGVGCGLLDLVDGEVLDGGGLDGVVGVAEFGAGEFGGGGPGGEDGGLRVVLVDEVDGVLVEDDRSRGR